MENDLLAKLARVIALSDAGYSNSEISALLGIPSSLLNEMLSTVVTRGPKDFSQVVPRRSGRYPWGAKSTAVD